MPTVPGIKEQYEDFLAGRAPQLDDDASPTTSEVEDLEFALEAHLRDFLAKNLDRLEPGLQLYQADGRNGVEFQVDGGRIDLLGVDHSGRLVVIELKLSQGRNKALGQLLYYMGWIDQHLGNGPCRGFIIASDISGELATAVSRTPGVSLAEYHLNFSITQLPG